MVKSGTIKCMLRCSYLLTGTDILMLQTMELA